MIECIVNYLCDKFGIKRDVAFIFYIQVLDNHQLNDLIVNMHKYETFEELKKHYLGGNLDELQ